MTEQTSLNGQALDEKLARLTKKPGVKASIVIDRASGAILKTSGDTSVLTTTKSRNAATAASFSNEANTADESQSKGLEDFGSMIWNFANSSGQVVENIDSDDELRLLRLRTKKQEIAIVLDQNYLLTVIHDIPQA
ncbi:Putative Dynein light chain-related protein [[Torrubiella] hemipterigena]|uniref:Putative Dynein light chain-related protein n=1 Tax=[Torrubiella] hemipterigena TaxID=1531966 RepID=A0A0A1TMF6_9HYPO|nr:Putative Dynein light chain-related protein [[Torrubiella] hemipterigena]